MPLDEWKLAKFNIATTWVSTLVEHSDTSDIVSYLDDFHKSKNGKKLREMFGKLSDKDRTTLYKDGALNIVKATIGMGSIGHIKSLFNYEAWKLKSFGPELSVFYRFLVHIGVVDGPWIPNDELIRNVKKDAKFIDTYMNVASGVCTVFAPEASPWIAGLKVVSKTLSKKAVEIAEQQLATNYETVEEVEIETKRDLKEDFDDISKEAA